MAHKKGLGSSKNGRDSESKRLGVKIFSGQEVRADTAATFAYSGSDAGKPDTVRYAYGNGHVILVTTHPEARAGSTVDWTYWDNYAVNSNTPVNNPDNPWQLVNAVFDNWLTLP